jgi:pilus assembly protein FimV
VAGAGAAAAEDLSESLADADLGQDDAGTAAKVGARSETSDVIGEADIYVAYGRYPQAIGLLLGVLEDDAGRNDVRLKLLELYAETRDRDAFDHHMAELVERCDDEEALLTARELSQQFGDAGTDNGDQEDALALDLDDVDAPVAVTDDAPARPEADEFELELDEADEGPTGQPASLGGDLGIDFDPARVDAPESDELPDIQYARDEAKDGDDLDLDLDLDAMDPVEEETFDFADEGDTASTKLDLARAYIDMGDQDGARDILNEVVAEGNAEQQKRAQAMLEEL